MISPSKSFDWNQARAFLATAERGSLSAAARVLNQTQPTIGRQLSAFEASLGLVLFDRVGRKLLLTEAGRSLLPHVRAMAEAAGKLSLMAEARSTDMSEPVTITASDAVAAFLLPGHLKRLTAQAPGLRFRVRATNSLQNVLKREADIAIRHVRPEQGDLIGRLVRNSQATLYARADYLAGLGEPLRPADLASASFIGFDDSERLAGLLNARGVPVTEENFSFASENGNVAWEMVRRGLGIGVMMQEIGDATDGIRPVLPDFEPIDVPIWLVAHRELATSARIRLVFDYLADHL
ncbi:LysR family transcriptional regulator [Roseibium sp.]|uniref:LysR family transcriptional regulator n=1 Tax=Roseibium sp. TaxID=1936156 RepID=UPI003A970308